MWIELDERVADSQMSHEDSQTATASDLAPRWCLVYEISLKHSYGALHVITRWGMIQQTPWIWGTNFCHPRSRNVSLRIDRVCA